MTQKKQVNQYLQPLFLIFNCQTPEYFEQGNPWNTREQARKACRNTILNSLQMIANLTFWLDALGEEAAHSVTSWLELDATWKVQSVHSGVELSGAEELVLPVISCGA